MIEKHQRKIIQKLILIFYISQKRKYVQLIFITKSNCEKKIILSMIQNEEKERWHCHAVKKLSALFHEITSKQEGDFFLLGFSSFF